MSDSNPSIRIALVGASGRGQSFVDNARSAGYTMAAICDWNKERLAECQQKEMAESYYDNYEQMLDQAKLDAVLISTPMQFHAPQATLALQRDIHVICEVTAAVSIDQCRELVRAARKSKAVYMMAENCNYLRFVQFIKGLVTAGLFGELYYAQGAYVHDVKWLMELTPWRRIWQSGVRGVTYSTHSMGPILAWMDDDRVRQVCCADSGSHYKDPRGEPYACDTSVFLARTVKGRLIQIRGDLVSDRPSLRFNTYQLQGTDGCFESSRGGPGDQDKIWLREISRNRDNWLDLETLMSLKAFEQYLPDIWRNPTEAMTRAGHDGTDYATLDRFARVIRGEIANPIDIDCAMDMTLPGLISQQAVSGDQWLEVPDSRQWTT